MKLFRKKTEFPSDKEIDKERKLQQEKFRPQYWGLYGAAFMHAVDYLKREME